MTAPVVGATKLSQVDGMVKSTDLKLSDSDISFLEELYIPHNLVGVMAQNVSKK